MMPAHGSPPARVASLSSGSVPCEFATRLAADAGLEVIKIERPDGDPLARRGHFFSFLAAGKRTVRLPERDDSAALAALLAECDAVVVDEWGQTRVAALETRPPCILVGERDSAALAGIPPDRSDEFLAFHGVGLGFLTPRVMPGYPSGAPLCPDASLIEMMSGLYGAIALFAALADPCRGTGHGDAVIGLTGVALPLLRREVAAIQYEGRRPHRSERIWQVSPAEVHRCRDGWLFVDVIEDVQWSRLCHLIGRDDLAAEERYATREGRFAAARQIAAILDDYFAAQPQSCWQAAQRQGIPIAPVNTLDDLVEDSHLRERGFWSMVACADGASVTMPTTPLARLFENSSRQPAQPMQPVRDDRRKAPRVNGATEGPLAGIRVIELTHVWAGPLCGQILADLGAEVIRVESRAHLDIHRRGGPYPDGRPGVNRSGTWNAQNRGKLSCMLNLKSEEGRDLLFALAGQSDVVIENFTPGTLERLDIGFDRLRAANPSIVLLSLSGFGQTGPYRNSMAYGPMMDAATGLSAATRYDDGIPRAVNGWAADVGGALFGCAAVVRTMLDRDRRAFHLDVSQHEAGVLFLAEALLARPNGGGPNTEGGIAVTAVVATEGDDRWLAVAARAPSEISALCALVAEPAAANELARLHRRDPAAGRAAIVTALAGWAAQRTRVAALAALAEAGVPAAPVRDVQELLVDEGLAARGAWTVVDHAELGPTRSYGPAIRLTGRALKRRAAPCLGADNAYVFGTILDLPPERLRDLASRGVV